MKTIFYSKESQFNLTDEEFEAFILKANKGEKVWIPRLNVFLSNMFIWAGDKPNNTIRKLHDGGYAIQKYGSWVLLGNEEIKLDLQFYPYLAKDMDYEEYKQLYGGNNLQSK